MRKLYEEFFYIPKHGKVRDKVMLTRVATTVSIILMCLVAMGITAYAYFSCNITSGNNTIKAASFEAKVSITMNGVSVAVAKEGDVQTAELDAGTYTVELTREEPSADKGFCVLTIDGKKYYTDQIGVDASKNLTDAGVKFDVQLSAPAKMEISSHWGTSVYYGYKEADRTEIFIENESTLDLTTKTQSNGDDKSEISTEPSEETISPAEPIGTGDSSSQTLENAITPPETTPPAQTTETIDTESTESTESESIEKESEETESTETELEGEDTETTETPITETNE